MPDPSDADPSDAVAALVAARRGHFRLESGHHGDLWLDLDAMFWSPAAVGPPAEQLAERPAPEAVDVVRGPLVGGALLGQLVAARSGSRRGARCAPPASH